MLLHAAPVPLLTACCLRLCLHSGLEFAGIVVETSPQDSRSSSSSSTTSLQQQQQQQPDIAPGARVLGVLRFGAFASHVAVPAAYLRPVPEVCTYDPCPALHMSLSCLIVRHSSCLCNFCISCLLIAAEQGPNQPHVGPGAPCHHIKVAPTCSNCQRSTCRQRGLIVSPSFYFSTVGTYYLPTDIVTCVPVLSLCPRTGPWSKQPATRFKP